MSQTIRISEKSAALLAQQAAAQGKSLEAWIEELALEKARSGPVIQKPPHPGTTHRSLVDRMRAFRSHVRPDPEGWTVRDYVQFGRR